MDQNNDGTLSREELMEGYNIIIKSVAYTKVYDQVKAEELIEEFFKKADLNNSNKIDFTEFLIATSNHEKLINKARLQKVFKMFDRVNMFFFIDLGLKWQNIKKRIAANHGRH
jgi:calcium-dependent protein kinase